MRRSTLTALIAVPVLLAASACSGGSAPQAKPKAATVAAISVSGRMGSAPHVSFKAPIEFDQTMSRTVVKGPGTGPAVTAASRVTVRYLGLNASNDTQIDSNFTQHAKPATFLLCQVIPGITAGLLGAHAGDRRVIAIPSKQAYDPTGNGTTVRRGDSVVFVIDVLKVVNPRKAPSSAPQVTYNGHGCPAGFTLPAGLAPHPKTVHTYTLLPGVGAKVKALDTLTVEYVGGLYSTGKVFDESWTKQPFTFQMNAHQVIAGWDIGLLGQRAGARVEVVIPAAQGYGKKGSPPKIAPNSDLVFVIDIMSVS
ncbi:MAG TPA: FKBP-type peptidyl-prolyl cis-trans isomerase [Nocardioidaceae bacterium]|nr:FKBP-type peptidyl-prolyl cis-trans isomerase [Nocardioidaceae bacterium]